MNDRFYGIGWDVGGWSGKNHGLSIVKFENNKISLEYAESISILQIISKIKDIADENLPSSSISLAVDAPLQFPYLFQQIFSQNEVNILATVQKSPKKNPLAWRETDLFIKKLFKKTPLSASFSFLSSNATVAISVLEELSLSYSSLQIAPFQSVENNNFIAFEAYPGILKSQIFNKTEVFAEYKKILTSDVFKSVKGFSYYFGESSEKTDTADACICALYALGMFELNGIPKLNKSIPTNYLNSALKEGWIYIPSLSV